MSLAWSAALLAQAALAMRLPPGPVRRWVTWQVLSGVALFAAYPLQWYRHAWTLAMVVDGALLIRASGRAWSLPIFTAVLMLPLGVGLGSAVHFDRPFLSWYAARYSLALIPAVYAIAAASGRLMAFAWLRYLFSLAGWWAWFTAPSLYVAQEWAQVAFFVAWAINANGPPKRAVWGTRYTNRTEET